MPYQNSSFSPPEQTGSALPIPAIAGPVPVVIPRFSVSSSSAVAGTLPGVARNERPAAVALLPLGDVPVTRHFSLTGENPAFKLALVEPSESAPAWRFQKITKIQTVGFCDWVSIYQRHFCGGLPVIADGALMRIDRHGETICTTLGKEKIIGSHETAVFVRCDGETVWFDGNVSKFGRTDNLFGYWFQECLHLINAVLVNLQLPPFTEGESFISNNKGNPKTVWTGAIVTRLDLTENHQTGSAANAYHFMQHLQGQQASRLKTGTYGDGETVDFGRGSRRLYFKAYLKGPELRRHITKDIKPSGAFNSLHGAKEVNKMSSADLRLHFADMPKNQYVLDVADWCDSVGLVRVEMTFKSTMLHSMGCNYLGALDMKQLEDVFTERCSIFTRATADVNEITDLPRHVLSTYRMWAAGDDVISKVSKATFYRHRSELLPYGVDIAIKSNVITLKTKTRVINSALRPCPIGTSCPLLKENIMQMLVEVVGMKAFKGIIDGKSMDSGTLYSNVKLDERFNKLGENFKTGDAMEEWKLGSSELVFRVAHLKPSKNNPIMMRLEVERVSNGRETKEIVTDAVPVEQSTARQSAKV